MQKLYKERGIFFSKDTCVYYAKNNADGQYYLSKRKTFLLVFRGLLTVVLITCMFNIYKTCDYYGINSSVMLCLTSMAIFFIAIVFYFLYDEKMMVKHIIGVNMIFGAALLIAYSNLNLNENDLDFS